MAEQLQPRKLLSNLEYTTLLNKVEDRTSITRLDWHQCLTPQYTPAERFPVVMGSDIIYYEQDAAALVAAILAHTSPGGAFYLMNRRGRPGLRAVLDLLQQHGSVEEEELTLINNFDSTPLLLAVFRPPP